MSSSLGFSVQFLDEDIASVAPGCRCGEICIGEFRERFASDMTFWTKEQYERQWLGAASLILIATKAALVTSVTEPATSNFVRLWVMYREDDTVTFQEQICLLADLGAGFDPERAECAARPRQHTSEDGEPISEWTTTLHAIRAFAEEQGP
jgi:CdiI N-terminal domain